MGVGWLLFGFGSGQDVIVHEAGPTPRPNTMIRHIRLQPSIARLSRLVGIVLLGSSLSGPVHGSDADVFPTPLQIGSGLRLDPGLRAELVAAEPQIESPVAMAFDEEGRLWVVEMRDYPHGPPAGQGPESRIKILEDRDGDGRYETSVVFEDAIAFPNGVLPWRGGAIVTAAPYIKWLKDQYGDGRADQGEILYEGFSIGARCLGARCQTSEIGEFEGALKKARRLSKMWDMGRLSLGRDPRGGRSVNLKMTDFDPIGMVPKYSVPRILKIGGERQIRVVPGKENRPRGGLSG